MPIRSRAGRYPAAFAAGGDPRAGYVLIEVVATLVITLMLLSFAFPSVPSGTTSTRMFALLSATVSLLRDARTRAIETGTSVPAVFDARTRSLRVGSSSVVVPPDVNVAFDTGGNCPAGGKSAEILFRADGTNCGGIVRLSKGARILRARVNWIDGRIDVLDGD